MAMLADVIFSSKSECLQGLAGTIGTFPPRAPIPPWWGQMIQESGVPQRALNWAAKLYARGGGNEEDKPWLKAFDAWYETILSDPKCLVEGRPGYFGFTVRMEAFTYEDDEDDEDDYDDPEGDAYLNDDYDSDVEADEHTFDGEEYEPPEDDDSEFRDDGPEPPDEEEISEAEAAKRAEIEAEWEELRKATEKPKDGN